MPFLLVIRLSGEAKDRVLLSCITGCLKLASASRNSESTWRSGAKKCASDLETAAKAIHPCRVPEQGP